MAASLTRSNGVPLQPWEVTRASEIPDWFQLYLHILNGPDKLEPSMTSLIASLCKPLPDATMAYPNGCVPSTAPSSQPLLRLIDALGRDSNRRPSDPQFPNLLDIAIKYNRPKIAMTLIKTGISVVSDDLSR
jgi:hypothetical protein